MPQLLSYARLRHTPPGVLRFSISYCATVAHPPIKSCTKRNQRLRTAILSAEAIGQRRSALPNCDRRASIISAGGTKWRLFLSRFPNGQAVSATPDAASRSGQEATGCAIAPTNPHDQASERQIVHHPRMLKERVTGAVTGEDRHGHLITPVERATQDGLDHIGSHRPGRVRARYQAMRKLWAVPARRWKVLGDAGRSSILVDHPRIHPHNEDRRIGAAGVGRGDVRLVIIEQVGLDANLETR